jgi:hypothetical protein
MNVIRHSAPRVVDAMTDLDADVHYNSVTRIFPKLGETGTTAEIIDLLETGSAAR